MSRDFHDTFSRYNWVPNYPNTTLILRKSTPAMGRKKKPGSRGAFGSRPESGGVSASAPVEESFEQLELTAADEGGSDVETDGVHPAAPSPPEMCVSTERIC